ncbi:hypothetical protein EBU99_14805, partial [bacterium]|nr:hypothetical protein [bacterium]
MSLRLFLGINLWLLSLCASIVIYLQNAPIPEGQEYVVSVTEKAGDVRYRFPLSSIWRPLEVGQQLPAGTAVSTGKKSFVKCHSKDGHEINVTPESQVVLAGIDDSARE